MIKICVRYVILQLYQAIWKHDVGNSSCPYSGGINSWLAMDWSEADSWNDGVQKWE